MPGETLYEYQLRALVRYKELRGNMLVSWKFIVPWSRDWPEEHWGLKLGDIVQNIRRGRMHADKKKELEAAGFDFAKQASIFGLNATGWEVVKAALLAYKAQHGDVLVPKSFVVPSDDPRWPESTWGVKLGRIVDNIRHKGTYKTHKQDLLDMGFVYKSAK